MTNVESRRLVAMGNNAQGKQFILIEEKINRNIIAYPIWVNNENLNCNICAETATLTNGEKIKRSQKFKRDLIKAYKVTEFGNNVITIVEKNKGHYALFVKVGKMEASSSTIRVFNPTALMGKKMVKKMFVVSYMYDYDGKTFLIEAELAHKSISFTLAFNFQVNIFKAPKGWTFIKTTTLGGER